MGQYHIPFNLDKKEFIHPHDMGDGLKLLEFGCSANGTMTGLAILLAASNGRGGGDLHGVDEDPLGIAPLIVGRWAGDRIAIIGDYHEPGDVPGFGIPENLWELAYNQQDGWTNISEHVVYTMELDGYIFDDRHEVSPNGWTRTSAFGGREAKSLVVVATGEIKPLRPGEAGNYETIDRSSVVVFNYDGKRRRLKDWHVSREKGTVSGVQEDDDQYRTFKLTKIAEQNGGTVPVSLRPDMVIGI